MIGHDGIAYLSVPWHRKAGIRVRCARYVHTHASVNAQQEIRVACDGGGNWRVKSVSQLLRIYHEGRLLFFRSNQQNVVGRSFTYGTPWSLSVALFPSFKKCATSRGGSLSRVSRQWVQRITDATGSVIGSLVG